MAMHATYRGSQMCWLACLLAYLAFPVGAQEKGAEINDPQAIDMSFFEYLGSMIEDDEAGWIDPLSMDGGIESPSEPIDQAIEIQGRSEAHLQEKAPAEADTEKSDDDN